MKLFIALFIAMVGATLVSSSHVSAHLEGNIGEHENGQHGRREAKLQPKTLEEKEKERDIKNKFHNFHSETNIFFPSGSAGTQSLVAFEHEHESRIVGGTAASANEFPYFVG